MAELKSVTFEVWFVTYKVGLIVILQAMTWRRARYFVSLQKFKRFDMHKKNVRPADHN